MVDCSAVDAAAVVEASDVAASVAKDTKSSQIKYMINCFELKVLFVKILIGLITRNISSFCLVRKKDRGPLSPLGWMTNKKKPTQPLSPPCGKKINLREKVKTKE